MNEIVNVYREFWTGRSVSEGTMVGNNWIGVELPGMGFRNAQTGLLIPAFRNMPPAGTAFPCITYPVLDNELFTNRVANTAFIYDRRIVMPDFLGLVDDVLRQFRIAVPLGGLDIGHHTLYFDDVTARRDFDDSTGATTMGIMKFNIRRR